MAASRQLLFSILDLLPSAVHGARLGLGSLVARELRRHARLALLEELLEVEEDLRVALRSGEGGERGAGGRGHLGVALRSGERREGVLRRGIEEEAEGSSCGGG